MPRIELSALQPDGTPHWVDLRELRVSRGDRKRVLKHASGVMKAVRATDGDAGAVSDDDLADSGFDFLDALLFYWVKGWSLTWVQTVAADLPVGTAVGDPLPLPKDNPIVLDVLDVAVGSEIEDALDPITLAMSGRKVSAKDIKDPNSPSEPSAASNR